MAHDSAQEPKRGALETIVDELRAREAEGSRLTYFVPAAWVPIDVPSAAGAPRAVNPYRFYLDHLEAILAAPAGELPSGDKPGAWVRDSVIYNVFVRLTTAYDHAHDGHIGSPAGADADHRTLNSQGVRESGTFLKTIALLGHARSLGATAVHLLPITAVGRFGNKGNLGSPYAIRNPYELEPTLADPLLEADADTQFRALVEACHRLGMRVIVEFVFRTASRDGDFVATHPDWFYWIKREVDDRPSGAAPDDPRYYGVPPFSEAELAELKDKVGRGDLHELPPPPWWYRDLFTEAPKPERIAQDAEGRYVGTLSDGRKVHVPSAFADWPPDDFQPPWTDVTYLRLYRDPVSGPSFNYIAYNTIRMYDTRLARSENANEALWDAVRGILPHWQREYGIDGCMVDMGHALPHDLMQDIIDDARRGHPDFALLSENFVVSEESVETGYNAVLGYQFQAVQSADQMRALISRCCQEGLPLPVFGAGETHNTPRVAMRNRGASFCRAVWLVNCFLPDTIPFIHAGFELAEKQPVNLGLAFTPEEVQSMQGTTLGLFDMTALHWDDAGLLPLEMGRIAGLRETFAGVAAARGPGSFGWLDGGSDDVIAFKRIDPATGQALVIVADWGCYRGRDLVIDTGIDAARFEDLLTHASVDAPAGRLAVTLQPGEGRVFRPV